MDQTIPAAPSAAETQTTKNDLVHQFEELAATLDRCRRIAAHIEAYGGRWEDHPANYEGWRLGREVISWRQFAELLRTYAAGGGR